MESKPSTPLPDAPTVSVAIPVYNRIPWAVEALRSVLDQTYTDFEVVVVDDGSTEDVAPLRDMDERVRYVRQENTGFVGARNKGLSLARGRYIAFMDADDLWASDKLEKQVALMEGRPDVAISHTSFQLIDRDGKYIQDVHSGRYSGWVYPRIYVDPAYIASPTVMVRRDALDETLRFNEFKPPAADVLFWSALAKKSEFLGIDEPLARIRMHGNNDIRNPDKSIMGITGIIRYGVSEDEDLPPFVKRRLISRLHVSLAFMYREKGDWGAVSLSLLRAARLWPLNHRGYQFLAMLAYRCVTGKSKKKQA